MDTTRFDDLLNRYLDADLSPDEMQDLQTILLSDPKARRRFWRDAQLHGSLRLLGEQESGAREARRELDLPRKDKVIHVGRGFWFGTAAAAVIALAAIGIGSWPSGDAAQDPHTVDEGKDTLAELVVEPSASRAKLSERLFSTRRHESTSERISAARDRVRQLRTNLHDQPTSRL